MSESASIDECLRITPQFRPDEYDDVRQQLRSKLEARLSRWPADTVDMELSVKDRDTNQQKVTLEVRIAARGDTRFVATSGLPDLRAAVNDVRDDVHRQVDRFLTKQETRRQG